MFTKTTTRHTNTSTPKAFDPQTKVRRHGPRRHPTIPRLDQCEPRALLSSGTIASTLGQGHLWINPPPPTAAPPAMVHQYVPISITQGADGNIWCC